MAKLIIANTSAAIKNDALIVVNLSIISCPCAYLYKLQLSMYFVCFAFSCTFPLESMEISKLRSFEQWICCNCCFYFDSNSIHWNSIEISKIKTLFSVCVFRFELSILTIDGRECQNRLLYTIECIWCYFRFGWKFDNADSRLMLLLLQWIRHRKMNICSFEAGFPYLQAREVALLTTFIYNESEFSTD